MCGRIIQSSGPLRLALVDGLNARDDWGTAQHVSERVANLISRRKSAIVAPITLRSLLPPLNEPS